MFSAKTSDPKLFRDCIDTISQLIDDGILKIKKNGIELVSADRATVAVVDFKIVSEAFEEYKCDNETSIGLNMLNFLTILKRAGSDDKMTLALDEKSNRLDINFQGKSVRKFSIPLLEISQEEIPPIDQLQFSAMAEVKSDIMEQGINDADIVADSVVIQIGDGFRMIAESDSNKAELNLERGNESLVNLDYKNVSKSRYPLDYLKKIIKAGRISDKAKISLGMDYPMKMEFAGRGVTLNFIVAPRVSED